MLEILGALALAMGAYSHASAKETNKMVQQIVDEAENQYETERNLLEKARAETEKELLKLGYQKKNILDGSMRRFLSVYEKIKKVELRESIGLDEIANFSINQEDIEQLEKMDEVCSTLSEEAGTSTGIITALAANGSVVLMADGLVAGSAFTVGELGLSAGVAGSALSFGAALAPLALLAAPVVLFSGISEDIKADENLEKAYVIKAEAKDAVEKMKVSETLCKAIAERADMFYDVLKKLDEMFDKCTALLEKVIHGKEKAMHFRKIKVNDLSEDEIRLIAVTRSLAGAIKAIIDTPILMNDGKISDDSQKICDETTQKLPDFEQAVERVENVDYSKQTAKEYKKAANADKLYSSTGYMGSYVQPKRRQPALGVASFVLGIISVISCGLLVITEIISIIFSAVVLCKKDEKRELAVAGLVMGVLTLLFCIGIYAYIFLTW